MKSFFSILIGCLSFFAANGQDTTVCIKPSTARYYLEVEDEMYVLREKDSLNSLLVTNLKEQVLTKDKIIRTYVLDEGIYAEYIETLEWEITYTTEELEQSYRDQKKLQRQRNIAIGGGVGAMVGSVIPGVGTLTGTLIGAGVGWVSSIFIKR